MNQTERIESMVKLPKHLGEIVSVTYVDQMNQQRLIRGKLKEVTPYSSVVVTYLEKVPEEMQDSDVFKGRKIMKSTIGIPFLSSPDAIMSIITKDGSVLYDNDNIRPFYNPHFFPTLNEDGRLRIGDDYNAGIAHTRQSRELSFGKQ